MIEGKGIWDKGARLGPFWEFREGVLASVVSKGLAGSDFWMCGKQRSYGRNCGSVARKGVREEVASDEWRVARKSRKGWRRRGERRVARKSMGEGENRGQRSSVREKGGLAGTHGD